MNACFILGRETAMRITLMTMTDNQSQRNNRCGIFRELSFMIPAYTTTDIQFEYLFT